MQILSVEGVCNIIPDICHGRHGHTRVNFFLAGVNLYIFNAKNWHFRQILREKVAFFTDLNLFGLDHFLPLAFPCCR